ncbi:hypothetical protein A2U01_0082562, partial [Trifolium medium]|nr:hypothetical protein [Trifolium medium]
ARREQVPAYFYPRYTTMEDFDAAHERRIKSMNDVHEVNRVTFIRQRDAAGSSQAGSSHVHFPGVYLVLILITTGPGTIDGPFFFPILS